MMWDCSSTEKERFTYHWIGRNRWKPAWIIRRPIVAGVMPLAKKADDVTSLTGNLRSSRGALIGSGKLTMEHPFTKGKLETSGTSPTNVSFAPAGAWLGSMAMKSFSGNAFEWMEPERAALNDPVAEFGHFSRRN